MKRPAEKILVVSENRELCEYLKATIAALTFHQPVSVDYRYTSYNHHPHDMIEFGAKEINVKDKSTVENIVRSYDMVFSLHCKQIFPKELVDNVCCVNFHPGYNPFNRGWYPQVFSILNGLPIGATIHLMDSQVDHGKIIAQRKVDIAPSDTSLEVYRKVIEAEKELISKNIFTLIEGTFPMTAPKEEGNYNGIKDYQKLCALNLSDVATLKEHLDLLRATTHGDFKNAYFTDDVGKKYFVRLLIEAEESA